MTETVHFQLPIPSRVEEPPENVDIAIDQFIAAVAMVDAILKGHADSIANKSNVGHGHPISAITGLMEALANKMTADRTFRLGELTDVSGADAAPSGYVLVKAADGWVVMSAPAAIGNHQHPVGDVVGLGDAIAAAVSALVASAPSTLDTLAELAAAIGNDPNFAVTFTNLLNAKADAAATQTALNGKQATLGFTPVRQGGGAGQMTNAIKIGWSAESRVKLTVDTTDMGNIAFDAHLIGVGQNWQDVKSIRAIGGAYQNTTPKPIMVSINLGSSATMAYVSPAAGGWLPVAGLASGQQQSVSFIVPPGQYYHVAGGTNILQWLELR